VSSEAQAGGFRTELHGRCHEDLDRWQAQGLLFLTAAEEDFPINLRLSGRAPSFLFARGQLLEQDWRAVAVVGTRACSDDGRRRAARLGRELAEAGVTVVSGLALGIDTAAHLGALAAGGRTIAVVGTGLSHTYPPENRALQERIITSGGAVLSQFWPDFGGSQGGRSFLERNRTMADLTLATLVVEASHRSGARSQAAYCRKNGGRVLLLRSLAKSEEWARAMAATPGCSVVESTAEVLACLPTRKGRAAPTQLTL
jgi:DNA processing protein